MAEHNGPSQLSGLFDLQLPQVVSGSGSADPYAAYIGITCPDLPVLRRSRGRRHRKRTANPTRYSLAVLARLTGLGRVWGLDVVPTGHHLIGVPGAARRPHKYVPLVTQNCPHCGQRHGRVMNRPRNQFGLPGHGLCLQQAVIRTGVRRSAAPAGRDIPHGSEADLPYPAGVVCRRSRPASGS